VKGLQTEIKKEVATQIAESRPSGIVQSVTEPLPQPKAEAKEQPKAEAKEQPKSESHVHHESKTEAPPKAEAHAHSNPAEHTEPSKPKSAKAELHDAMDLVQHAGPHGRDNAALHLVQTRPELLKSASPRQLGALLADLSIGTVHDAERSAVLGMLKGKSGSEIQQIVQAAGGEALAKMFIGHDSGHQPAELLREKGLTGEKSPLRDYFRNEVTLDNGDRGFASIGNVDDLPDGVSRELAKSTLLLDAATPTEKGKMLYSLIDGDVSSDDQRGM